MNIILNIILTAVITFASFFAVENYVPLKYLETKQDKKLGVSITTIASTDTLKNSRTTINDNFTALNDGKIENSTTTLPLITTLSGLTSASALATVGTITSGTWSGTAILTAKGGTGSTTLASNQVLLGNGTGNIGIVAGLGTTGQFLTSTGAGTAPTWQTSAVDTAINYTWTGLHTFSATTTLNSGVDIDADTDSPLIINTQAYVFPTTDGTASSTVLMTDGSGNLSWNSAMGKATSTGTVTISNSIASETDTITLGFRPRQIIVAVDGQTIGATNGSEVNGMMFYTDGQNKTAGTTYTWYYGGTSSLSGTTAITYANFILSSSIPLDSAGTNLVDGNLTISNITSTGFDLVFTRTDTAGTGASAEINYRVIAIE